MTARTKRFGIILIPTWACNNTCDHCFEQLLPQSASADFWELFFRRAREFAESMSIGQLVVYWQGGEVLTMPPREVERGLQTGERLFADSATRLEHHLQTNLMGYSRDWRDIIANFFGASISSSLDYPNAHRSTPCLGVERYNEAWIAKKAEAERDGFTVNVITLPNPATFDSGADRFYRFFRDEVGVRSVQVNFPFPGIDGAKPARLDRERLGHFMHDLYRVWIANGRDLMLNPFRPLEERLLRGEGTLPCALSFSCAHFLFAVGPDGEVGQCDCWLSTRKEHGFGYLAEASMAELLEAPTRRPFLARSSRMIDDPECGACEFWSICFGGCPLRAYAFSNDFYSRDYYCPVYRSMCQDVVEERYREAVAVFPSGEGECLAGALVK